MLLVLMVMARGAAEAVRAEMHVRKKPIRIIFTIATETINLGVALASNRRNKVYDKVRAAECQCWRRFKWRGDGVACIRPRKHEMPV